MNDTESQVIEAKKFYVYLITNILRGRVYVGKTSGSNPTKRWYKHQKNLSYEYACDECPKLYNSMRKYGIANFSFEVIEEWDNEDYAYQREAELVEFYDSVRFGLNCKTGGKGGLSGSRNPMWGKGYLIAGEKNGMYGMTGDKNPMFGKKHTPEIVAGIKERNRVLSNDDVRIIKEMLFEKKTGSQIREKLGMPKLTDVSISRIKSGKRYADVASEIVLTEKPHISAQDAEDILRLWQNKTLNRSERIYSQDFYKTEIEGKYDISPEKIRNLLKGNTWPSIHQKLAAENKTTKQ
jgi:group I intron endonuclease